MIAEAIQNWLKQVYLTDEQKVLSRLLLRLADSFDENGSTSTAAELRKTMLELQRSLGNSSAEIDPLEKLLTR